MSTSMISNPISCIIDTLKSKSHYCINKIEVKNPQLTLGDLAHVDRHGDENTKVLVQQVKIPLFAQINLPLNMKQYKNDNIANFDLSKFIVY